ncbi:hypothetical protein [Devosia sp.]|uniref:NACHT domain-containing protein n=1 Tax=Devosia sp. TaxID=1871048 RepID=UPI001AC5EF39|nr:hypothetical protein [Devosia sp.]MBN9334230.1 hypothetical protein [Devosia sp.]
MPDLFETRRLGELDRLGSDIVDFGEAGNLRLVVQCKGFEKPIFGDSQLQQCLQEIAKYSSSGPQVESYWLALNRAVIDSQHRNKIQCQLDHLVTSGKVTDARLLDFNQIISTLEEVVVNCLRQWASQRQEQSAQEHADNLAVVDYLSDVPFKFADMTRSNPSHYFSELVRNERNDRPQTQFGKDRKPPRILLKGSFGYGKTSALLAASALLLRSDIRPIYLRAADLKDTEAFGSGYGLLAEILGSFVPEDADLSDLASSLAIDTLRREFKHSDDWVLLIDAIDESPFSNNPSKLAALWGGAIDAGLPVLVSVRSELVDQREREFTINPKSLKNDLFQVLDLDEWTDELIGQFLESFSEKQAGMPSSEYLELQALVADGNYQQAYGDIPRRPLFLGMLAEDIWHSRASPKRLCDLYESYFTMKFERDRYSGGYNRPFEFLQREGLDETLRLLFLAMEEIASAINEKYMAAMTGGSNEVRNLGYLSRDEIDGVLRRVRLDGVGPTELALHSVVVPAGRDRHTKQMLFRFAHASFEDYFNARWLFRRSILPGDESNDAVKRFYSEMT